jgi:hypothetical protein
LDFQTASFGKFLSPPFKVAPPRKLMSNPIGADVEFHLAEVVLCGSIDHEITEG